MILLYQPQNPSLTHPLAKMNLAVSDIGKLLQGYGLSEDTTDILISSWRPATRQQYWTYFKSGCCFVVKEKLIHLKQLK